MMQLHYFLGIWAFKFLEIWVFLMIKNNILALATGTLIPLMLLPDALVAAMKYLPFYYVTYLPTMLLMGRNTEELFMGLGVLAVWNAAFLPLNHILYERLRRRYDGVGI